MRSPAGAEDRQSAEALWSRLKDLTEEQQVTVVSVGAEFQSWELAERLMEESATEASRDLERAASLARLAREVADRVPGPEGTAKPWPPCGSSTKPPNARKPPPSWPGGC
jgi:hypothetical protein